MVERVRRSHRIRDILIATTELPEDAALAQLAERVGVKCFRGSSDDVVGRMSAAARTLKSDVIVELLGDNPLVHSELIDDVIEFYDRAGNPNPSLDQDLKALRLTQREKRAVKTFLKSLSGHIREGAWKND